VLGVFGGWGWWAEWSGSRTLCYNKINWKSYKLIIYYLITNYMVLLLTTMINTRKAINKTHYSSIDYLTKNTVHINDWSSSRYFVLSVWNSNRNPVIGLFPGFEIIIIWDIGRAESIESTETEPLKKLILHSYLVSSH
jgi:hypothetical protein